ncbi:MAG: hypothetical protein MUO23_12950 [Anaerolineales bacterium]|nr:hypothetical protein [Anaerolineales bacterium]
MDKKPWAAATMKLQTGEEMQIRAAKLEAAELRMQNARNVMVVGHDFSDIVAPGLMKSCSSGTASASRIPTS